MTGTQKVDLVSLVEKHDFVVLDIVNCVAYATLICS